VNSDHKIKYPPGKWKAKLVMEKTLEFFNQRHLSGEIQIKSEIPIGKGMSSTAVLLEYA